MQVSLFSMAGGKEEVEEDSKAAQGIQQVEICSAFSASDKIPPFIKKDPELWFCQVEAVFARAGITNSVTKFQTVIPRICSDILLQASDIVKRPGSSPYESLKDRLINAYSDSETRRIQELLEGKQLGDEKPSRLLRQMQQLAGETIPAGVLKPLWMRSLPQNMQAILISTGQMELEKLAEVADKIQEVSQPYGISAVASDLVEDTSHSKPLISTLEAKIDLLAKQVAALTTGQGRYSRGRNRTPNRLRNRSRSAPRTPGSPDWLCFYHFRFREKATKCELPCAWKQKQENSYADQN